MVLHQVELRGGGRRDSLEEVVGAGYGNDLLGARGGGENTSEGFGGGEVVMVAGDEELGLCAGGQELVRVAAARGRDGEPEADQAGDAWIASASAKSNIGAEREAGKQDRFSVQCMQVSESGSDVIDFAAGLVMLPLGESGSAEVEAQHGQVERGEGLHRVVDDFVVHGSTEQRMRVRHHS